MIKKSISTYNIEIILIFITGFIVGSSWAKYLLSTIGINFFIFELFLIPYLIYKRKLFFSLLKDLFHLTLIPTFLYIILFCSILFGTINNNGNFISVFTTTRPFFYIILIINYFYKTKDININKIYTWSIASIIGEAIFIQFIQINRNWYYINVVTLALIIIIPLIEKKPIKYIFSMCLGLFISIISGYRINLLIIIVGNLTALFWIIFFNFTKIKIKQLLKRIFLLVIIIFFLIIIIQNYIFIIDMISKFIKIERATIYRITDRLKYFLMGDFSSSQDTTRLNNYKMIPNEFNENLIPTGLIGKTLDYYGTYTDVPIILLFESFGSVLSIFILIVINLIGFIAFIKSFYCYNITQIVAGLMYPIFIILFVINGTFIYFTNVSLMTALIISRWFSYYKFKS